MKPSFEQFWLTSCLTQTLILKIIVIIMISVFVCIVTLCQFIGDMEINQNHSLQRLKLIRGLFFFLPIIRIIWGDILPDDIISISIIIILIIIRIFVRMLLLSSYLLCHLTLSLTDILSTHPGFLHHA